MLSSMDKMTELKEQAASLSLYNTRDKLENLIHEAEKAELTYTEFISRVFSDVCVVRDGVLNLLPSVLRLTVLNSSPVSDSKDFWALQSL